MATMVLERPDRGRVRTGRRAKAGPAPREVLVSTGWVEDHLADPGLRFIEVDVDTAAYDGGHLPGAVGWNWREQLCDQVRRDLPARAALDRLLTEAGVNPDATVILYGDNNNWFACYAYWMLRMHGHPELRIMDGGRRKWVAEGRPMVTAPPVPPAASYRSRPGDRSLRAFLPRVLHAEHRRRGEILVDVRTPAEFTGEVTAPPGSTETSQRGGHIPGAINMPWGDNCRLDGTFRGPEELRRMYAAAGVTPTRKVITYCRIGERSSLTWFVLHEMLGFPSVANYDGSWTEYGNHVGLPIARGSAASRTETVRPQRQPDASIPAPF